jgi:hypothetical protein
MDLPRQLLGLVGLRHLAFELSWKYRLPFKPKTAWNDRYKAFFIHIPKTAGTSIYDSLEMDSLPYTHAPARVLQSMYPAEYRDYFTFAFVRNPWDRFVSTFEFLKTGSMWPAQQQWARRYIGDASFEDFVRRIDSDLLYRSAILSYNFFYSQSYFLHDIHGRCLVERIYRFEEIEAGFLDLAGRFQIDKPLAHSRKSARRPDYKNYYNRETWAIVARLYRADIRGLNYAEDF